LVGTTDFRSVFVDPATRLVEVVAALMNAIFPGTLVEFIDSQHSATQGARSTGTSGRAKFTLFVRA
jgi:hypothetical protein